jgi:hypothetical protein
MDELENARRVPGEAAAKDFREFSALGLAILNFQTTG